MLQDHVEEWKGVDHKANTKNMREKVQNDIRKSTHNTYKQTNYPILN